jgi:hypothetical protein
LVGSAFGRRGGLRGLVGLRRSLGARRGVDDARPPGGATPGVAGSPAGSRFSSSGSSASSSSGAAASAAASSCDGRSARVAELVERRGLARSPARTLNGPRLPSPRPLPRGTRPPRPLASVWSVAARLGAGGLRRPFPGVVCCPSSATGPRRTTPQLRAYRLHARRSTSTSPRLALFDVPFQSLTLALSLPPPRRFLKRCPRPPRSRPLPRRTRLSRPLSLVWPVAPRLGGGGLNSPCPEDCPWPS